MTLSDEKYWWMEEASDQALHNAKESSKEALEYAIESALPNVLNSMKTYMNDLNAIDAIIEKRRNA